MTKAWAQRRVARMSAALRILLDLLWQKLGYEKITFPKRQQHDETHTSEKNVKRVAKILHEIRHRGVLSWQFA